MEIVKELLSNGTWHVNNKYTWKSIRDKKSLKICETIMGCGLMQVWGIYSIREENFEEYKEVFDLIRKDYNRIGAIIVTLGQSHYAAEPFIFSLGFTLMQEYKNYIHGDNYTQRIYILKL